MSSPTSSRDAAPVACPLAGKRAVVTGSASGIGRATAEALARAGARVAGVDLNESDTEVSIVGSTADVEAVERAADALGGVDIWVNNAARLFVRPVVETSDEDWHSLLGANLHGYFYGCRAAGRRMLAQGTGGRIVNVTSAVNVLAVAGLSAYGAAKGAIAALTKALALELAPARDHGQRGRAGRDRHGAERERVHAGGASHLRAADPARADRHARRRSPTRSSSSPRTRLGT